MAMNTEIKKEWIKRLRSGEYKQCKSMLSNNVGYCCLGVLALVMSDKDLCITEKSVRGLYVQNHGMGDGSCVFIPGNILAKIDLGVSSADTLSVMNDHDNLSFNEIADYIEEHL